MFCFEMESQQSSSLAAARQTVKQVQNTFQNALYSTILNVEKKKHKAPSYLHYELIFPSGVV